MKSKNSILIRDWTEKDFSTVRKILLLTWKDAYHFIPDKDLLIHIENYYNHTKLMELFKNPLAAGILAEINSKPVGWMKLFDDQIAEKFFVSSLYVLPECQGLGIGGKLLSKAEEIALKSKYDRVWLGVMKDNIKALEWYRKIGFQFVEEEPFKMGETEVMHLIGYKIIS